MARSQEAYDRVERAVEVPMVVLSLAFLPVIVLPALSLLGDWAAASQPVDAQVFAIVAA